MKKKEEKHPAHRKRYPINWDEVDKFLMAGASGVQISAVIGITHETLYERCLKEKKVPFSTYSLEKRQKGNSMLLGKQYQVAMQGNTTMLVWLGKQRLEQKEPKEKDQDNELLLKLIRRAICDGTLADLSKQLQDENKEEKQIENKDLDESKQ